MGLARTPLMLVGGLTVVLAALAQPRGQVPIHSAPNVVTGQDTLALLRYDRRLLLETTSETSANVGFGDVDGDGNLDLVLAKGRHWPLVDRVLLGDGRGGIRAAYDLGTRADRSYSGRLVDLDGNGSLDIVISNDAPDPKLVYLNDGKGHFQVGSTYGRTEWETRNASVADLNSDGLPDIIVANRSEKEGANYLCLNRGGGRFDADCIAFSHYPATTITPADFNHDGRIDLAVPHRDGGQSYLYLAGPKGGFSDTTRVPFGPPDATIRMTDAADFNRDGFMDLVAIDERSGVTVYFGEQGGSFSSGVVVAGPANVPYALAVGDLNRDDKIDIAVGHVEAPSAVYFNDGSGRRFTPVRFGDNKGTVYGFAIGDLDHDGLSDIAAARSEAPNVVYFATRRNSKGPPAPDTVSVSAADGGVIAADVYGEGPRGVVLAHGGRFDKGSWREQALVLSQAGFRVLAIDFRAAVSARAGTETECLYDPACLAADVLAAVRFLRRGGAQSVAVVGGSLGGGAAAQASVDAAPGEIDRVVLLAGMPIEHPERMKGRKLFIVSRDDLGSGDVPRLPGIRDQYEKAADPKEMVVLDGSAHAQFIFSTEQGEPLMATILRFLTQP